MITEQALTLEDTFKLKTVTDAQISPAGELIAFVSGDLELDGTKPPRSNV